MKRKVGRYPNIEYYEEILRLPGKQLFSPSQIAHRKYDKKTHPELHSRMFHALYRFGERNGLKDKPDNCLRHRDGRPIVTQGKHELIPGQGRAKWYGTTWRNALYDDDLVHFQKQLRIKLTKTLASILAQKRCEEEKVVPMPIPSKNSPRLRWLLVALVAIALTATSFYNYPVLHEGYAIMRTQGAKAALEFFQNRGESYDTMFGIGWNAFREGDFETAEAYGTRVLKSRKMKDKARANYLLGILKTNTGQEDQAEEHLKSSLAIYESLGKAKSAFQSQLALARLHLNREDLEIAEYYANLAETTYDAWDDHFFLYIKSQIAYFKNDFDGALALVKEREQLAQGDESQLGGIYGDIGFYSCLIGDFDTCFEFTMKAQHAAQKLASNKLAMYNNVNLYLYQKCTFKDYAFFRETVLDFARKNKDTRIMEYVYFVDKFQCPLPRPDPGDPDPPDEDPPKPPQERSVQNGNEVVTGATRDRSN